MIEDFLDELSLLLSAKERNEINQIYLEIIIILTRGLHDG